MMANLWNVGGQVSLLSIFFPPVLIYRLFLQLEFKDAQFVYQMIEGGSPLAMISGEDILMKVSSSFYIIITYVGWHFQHMDNGSKYFYSGDWNYCLVDSAGMGTSPRCMCITN